MMVTSSGVSATVHLQASLAEKAAYLNLSLFGGSDNGGGMYQTEENCWRLRDPQNYGEANPGLNTGGSCQHRMCKSVWSNPGGAVSQLWL